MALAARITGVSAQEVIGHTIGGSYKAINRLVRAGELLSVHDGVHVRHFSNPVFADAFKLHLAAESRERALAARAAADVSAGRAGWADDASAHASAHVPAGVRVQVCPPYMPRFEAVALPIYGGNQRGRVMVAA
jgi:hypothetical protein